MIAVVLSVLGLLAGGAGVTLAIAANNRAGKILVENTELIRSQLAAAGIGAAGTGAAGTAAAGTAAARTAAARTGSLDPRAIRDVALVRYDALKEMAGQLSFSIAMLNAAGDGIVLTSINGRSETRTYAKAISGGQGAQSLSPEEEQAVRSARLGQSLPAVPAQGAGLEDGVTFVRSGRAQERR